MTNKEHRSRSFFICILLIVLCFLLFSGCGRRGDPVPIMPGADSAAGNKDVGEKKEDALKEQKKDEPDAAQAARPAAPTGLRGLYTQTSIILTWNEVSGQNIRYRIYRSAGDRFVLAGETATPAFTDRNVEPDKNYHYRISAVSAAEGPPSEEIIIVTEIQ
jgi:hypothetical protein